MGLSKKTIFFIVLLLLFFFFGFGLMTKVEANSGPLSVPQEVLNEAISSNWNNPNVVILKDDNSGFYYCLGTASDTGSQLDGNWVARSYKGFFGLTNPGWNVMHCRFGVPGNWNWATTSVLNSINSNSFAQLDGSFNSRSIVYNYKDILNTDGTVFKPSYTNEFLSPVILNTDEQLSSLDFDLLDIRINDATTSPFYLYLFNVSDNNRLIMTLDLYQDYDEFIQRMDLNDPFSPLIFRIPIGSLPRFSYKQGDTYLWQLQPAFGENSVDRRVLSTVNATGGGSSGSDSNEQINNSLNEINSGISDINNSISDTNNFIKDEDYSPDSITNGMPSNDSVNDITAESLDNFFNLIKNAFTSSDARDIVIYLPFVEDAFITIPVDLLSSHLPSVILSLIHSFYWFIISVFIYKDIVNYIDKLKSGDILGGTQTNIKADML